jgi:betaine-aldehyde dehydrogenase
MKVRDSEEALRLANDSRYGLAASVFGEKERREKDRPRIEAGSVNVNDVVSNMAALGVPMGGWKQSGIGYRHGEYGIKKYCAPSRSWSPASRQARTELVPLHQGPSDAGRQAPEGITGRDLKRRLGKRG